MALAGAPVAGVVGWAPTSARQALTVTIFSYAGGVTFGFGTDTTVLPDADVFVDLLDEELAEAVTTVGGAGRQGSTASIRDRHGSDDSWQLQH